MEALEYISSLSSNKIMSKTVLLSAKEENYDKIQRII
jgi:hypothetical protein